MAAPYGPVLLPERRWIRSPTGAIALRFAIALMIVLVNWLIVVVESGSYTDSHDGHVSVVDALYYTTVTLTTTGYGDITPVTTGARLINALVVTPMRLLFVILLVGTTLKVLTRQSRDEFRLARWRKRMQDHVVVLGYGTKGRNAVRALVLKGTPADRIVVVDARSEAVAAATESGHGGIRGSALDEAVLRQALVERARTVIIAVGRDDSAVLASLTVRRLNPAAAVIAAAREAHNAALLKQSGASSVVVSSETAGRLLGLAAESPRTVEVFEDLLAFGQGLDLTQRETTAVEVGQDPVALPIPVLAVVRAGTLLHYNDPAAAILLAGDQLIYGASRDGDS
ncbi:MAG: TrkA-N domain protein [Pseudonocardiales bacterium]|nr:TrkA-N domain protein [Pseudonocardiales bacterium]